MHMLAVLARHLKCNFNFNFVEFNFNFKMWHFTSKLWSPSLEARAGRS